MAITLNIDPFRSRRERKQLEQDMLLKEFSARAQEERAVNEDRRLRERDERTFIRDKIAPAAAAMASRLKAAGDPRAGVFEDLAARALRNQRGGGDPALLEQLPGGIEEFATPPTVQALGQAEQTSGERTDNRIIELRQKRADGTITANETVELEYRDQAKTIDERDRKRMLDIEDVILQSQRGRGRAPTQRELSEHRAIRERIQSRLNIMNLLMGGLLNQAPAVAGALNSPLPVGSVQVGVEDATGRGLYRAPDGRLLLEDGTPVPAQ